MTNTIKGTVKLLASLVLGVFMTHTPLVSLAQESGDEQAIRRLSAAWVAAMQAKDVPRLLNMLADDVVFLPPEFPAIRGKAAVEAMYASFFPQFSTVEMAATIEEVRVEGKWAFAWGNETLTLVPGNGVAAIQLRSRGLSILERQTDGSWKFLRALTQPITSSQ